MHGLSAAKTIADVIEIASSAAGRPVTVVRQNETFDNYGSAFTYNFPDRSVIVLREGDQSFYRTRGLFHEVGHLVFGHKGCSAFSGALDEADADERNWPRVVHANLRALYGNDPEELEAEGLAILIGRHLLKPRWGRDESIYG